MPSFVAIRRLAQSACAASIVGLVVLAAVPQTQAQTKVQTASVTARNEAIVRAAFDKWANGTSRNIFGELLAPDVKWTILGSGPVAGTYNGLKDFVDRASAPLVTRLATPIVPKVHNIWAVGDVVIVRFDGSATTTSGAPYANQFVWIFRMTNGVVTEAEAFLDLTAYQKVVDNNLPRAN